MNPTIASAWIALVGVVVGVGGAYVGSRFIASRTIEADRRVRVWEKRAEVYTDAVAGMLQLVKVRRSQLQHMTTETEPEHPPAPGDWHLVEARLIAYASDNVLEALDKAKIQGSRFDAAFSMWLAGYAQPRAATPPAPDGDPLTAQRIGDPMEVAKEALPEATMMSNNLMNIIRHELYAGPSRMLAPQREADLTKMAQDDVGA